MLKSVREYQARLAELGFYTGPIDGKAESGTKAALLRFQTHVGIEADGKYGPQTEGELFEENPDRCGEYGACVVPVDRRIWPHERDVESFFGAKGANQVRIHIPWDCVFDWSPYDKVGGISVHKKVAEPAQQALAEIRDTYSLAEIQKLGLDKFGGSLNVRLMVGSRSRWSLHSWGIALDWNPARNGYKTKKPVARLSHADAVPFWQAWEKRGAVSLGREFDYDWMHVQFAHR